ncbi:SIR2 family protein [Enterobacter asburiae]|uniref:SIR2 family protein n=1 Tax=Enterobacter asburiae TaxID=61645 RepID=UPI0018C28CD9|nr:SIR2 family protein [Enterobacter asburiae]MBG0653644.1 SIR2 family protein [Enterobacter asburiae]HCM9322031.1 SIR2 family protein [Enterobacter roggenkampii]
MSISIFNNNDLIKSLVSDIKRNKKISFLIGSAMSYENGCGFPNVQRMLSIIQEYLTEINSFDDEARTIIEGGGTKAYQDIYEYIFKTGGDQNDIRKLMKRYLDSSINSETGKWYITNGLLSLAEYISVNGAKVENILTTNFDPFIETVLEERGMQITPHALDYNSNINSVLRFSEKNVNVVHLHGFHTGDTMHTSSQLNSVRAKVKESIRSVLSNSDNLYVLGYGGWDDIFISSLEDIVEEFDASYNIRWAFYSESEGEILHNNKKLFTIVSPAIAKGRFHPYKGIDCHKLFTEVNKNLLDVGEIQEPIIFNNKHTDNDIKTLAINDVFNPRAKKKDNSISLIPFNLPLEKAHEMIRLYDQHCAHQYLLEEGGFILECGWGYGKLGFISSLAYFDDLDKIVFRTDFEGITSRKQAEHRINENIGTNISNIFAIQLKSPILIIIDNINDADDSLLIFLSEIVSLAKESRHPTSVILVTYSKLNLNLNKITLKQLDIDDVKEYLNIDSARDKITPNQIDKIYLLTSGIPAKLDKIQEYKNVMSLSDILEEDSIEISEERLFDNVPQYLIDHVNSLSLSENIVNKRLYQLLSVLSVLECGETAKNIKNYFHEHDFKLDDFPKLLSLNLVISIEKNDYGSMVILKINPLIKDYIKSKLTTQTVVEILHNSMGIIYGPEWESIKIKLSTSVKTTLLYQDFYPGNAHLLTFQYLKYCYQTQNSYTEKITKLCIAYCMFLRNEDRFKELASFSESVYHLLKINNSEDTIEILFYYSEGIRMIGNDLLVIELLQEVVETDRNILKVTNSTYEELLCTYMLSLSMTSDEKAVSIASRLLEVTPNRSSSYYQAKTIIASQSGNKKTKVQKLKKIEKEARKDGRTLVANNICLQLVNLNENEEDKYLKLVLSSEENTYTRIRALVSYGRKLFNTNPDKLMTGGLLTTIVDAYRYLFIQRISLFNRCHELLWDIFIMFAKLSDLYQLYKTSSIIWRLNGDSEREHKYSKELMMYARNHDQDSSEYFKYIESRYKHLSQNIQLIENNKSTD